MVHVPYIAIAVAFALIYLPRQIVSLEMKKLEGGYNNHDPRAQQGKLDGLGRRALGAHHNGFEAFAPFAVGVLAAIQRGVRIETVAYLSIAFVVVRTGYTIAYLADKTSLRSGLWGLGVAAIGTLMVFSITV
jgi:uncharacterized MAPEG superfamily protein